MRNVKRYITAVVDAGGRLGNIQNIMAHYLYGTPPRNLARASRRGIVYNPPGHG